MHEGNNGKEMNYWRPEAVGNVGTVWPPGITGLKINHQTPYQGMQVFGPITNYSYIPYHMITPMYLGFPYSNVYGYPIIQF